MTINDLVQLTSNLQASPVPKGILTDVIQRDIPSLLMKIGWKPDRSEHAPSDDDELLNKLADLVEKPGAEVQGNFTVGLRVVCLDSDKLDLRLKHYSSTFSNY